MHNMHKLCTNMQNQICINMHKYVFYHMHKYELYAGICIRINMHKYASLNMHKYAQNMPKICSDPTSISPMHSYAFICIYMHKICKNM